MLPLKSTKKIISVMWLVKSTGVGPMTIQAPMKWEVNLPTSQEALFELWWNPG